MYFDAHLHTINEHEILNARQKGINGFIINATQECDWPTIIELSKKYSFCHATIGIHPWFVHTASNQWKEKMESLLKLYPSVNIGEVGLDALKENKEKQLDVFLTSLELAAKYNRTVHIHSVKSWDLILKHIKNYSSIPFLFHRFNGSKEIINNLKKHNVWYSVISEKNVELLPQERVLTETDSNLDKYNSNKMIQLVDNFPIKTDQLKQNFQNFIKINAG